MVQWLDRQEKIKYFDHYLTWHFAPSIQEPIQNDEVCSPDEQALLDQVPLPITVYEAKLAKKPKYAKQNIRNIGEKFMISYETLVSALKEYEARITLPILDNIHDQIEKRILRAVLPTESNPGVFDVVFIDTNPESTAMQIGIQDFQVGQLHLIFRPAQLDKTKSNPHSKHLAYIEWFTSILLTKIQICSV
ncbi:hypothetical protein BU17DRAFT_68544 [Hysterangium stoloniferum]|nr:hypothetical protein BU17DRAFT_68544 [Hysterangium stoloniferum]